MKIYSFFANSDRFQYLLAKDGFSWVDFNDTIKRTDLVSEEIPRLQANLVRSHPDQRRRTLMPTDFPSFGLAVCCSERARSALDPLLDDVCEWLPVEAGNEVYWVMHITRVLDALDREKSDVRWLAADRAESVRRYAFRSQVVGSDTAFRLPELGSQIFFTDAIVDRATSRSLAGATWKELWSDGQS